MESQICPFSAEGLFPSVPVNKPQVQPAVVLGFVVAVSL